MTKIEYIASLHVPGKGDWLYFFANSAEKARAKAQKHLNMSRQYGWFIAENTRIKLVKETRMTEEIND